MRYPESLIKEWQAAVVVLITGLGAGMGVSLSTSPNWAYARHSDQKDARLLQRQTTRSMCLFHNQHSRLIIEYRRQRIPKKFAISLTLEQSPELAFWRKQPFHPKLYLRKKMRLRSLLGRYANYVYRSGNGNKSDQQLEPVMLRICMRFYRLKTPIYKKY